MSLVSVWRQLATGTCEHFIQYTVSLERIVDSINAG